MTLLLARADVERLLAPAVCIGAVEDAFRRHALGETAPPGILGMHAGAGSFHVKAAALDGAFAAKLNANFPGNPARGLPTIQGVVIVCDAQDGRLLALMDSMAITALRTAAATAVAAKYLSRSDSNTLLICGCGAQAPAQLAALLAVRRPKRVLAYDQDPARAARLAGATVVSDLGKAVAESDIVITCTTARRYFITRDMVRPGTFIAAVGADHEEKQEIEPQLMANAKVVTDLTEQAATIGDLHHAIDAGAMSRNDVHAQLGEVVAGRKRGRARDEEITIFDSTGTGLQDAAAAIAVYRGASQARGGLTFDFSGGNR
ncbi:MAG TPA: ornithine cyclodeaminase family protein [Burkholderiales bacterium]|nr:ornithine cyclodeaminase family protein [Burkholderiales bacterium]